MRTRRQAVARPCLPPGLATRPSPAQHVDTCRKATLAPPLATCRDVFNGPFDPLPWQQFAVLRKFPCELRHFTIEAARKLSYEPLTARFGGLAANGCTRSSAG